MRALERGDSAFRLILRPMIVAVLMLLFCLPGGTALGDRGREKRKEAAKSRENSGQRREKKISVGSKTNTGSQQSTRRERDRPNVDSNRRGNVPDRRRTPPGRRDDGSSGRGKWNDVKPGRRDPRIDRRHDEPEYKEKRDKVRPRWERPPVKPKRRKKPPGHIPPYIPSKKPCPDIIFCEPPVYVSVEPCEPPWIPLDPYAIPLPFDILYPEDIDKDFFIMIDELYTRGDFHYQFVCLVQMVHPNDREELHLLARDWYIEDMVIYKELTSYTYLVRLPVEMIYHLFYNSRIRWIGEYKSEYKCAHFYWEGFDGGTFITSLEGDRPVFREDLEAMGLEVIRFDDSLQAYYVKADWYDFPEIAQLWWIESVYQKRFRPIRTYELLQRASLDR